MMLNFCLDDYNGDKNKKCEDCFIQNLALEKVRRGRDSENKISKSFDFPLISYIKISKTQPF